MKFLTGDPCSGPARCLLNSKGQIGVLDNPTDKSIRRLETKGGNTLRLRGEIVVPIVLLHHLCTAQIPVAIPLFILLLYKKTTETHNFWHPTRHVLRQTLASV